MKLAVLLAATTVGLTTATEPLHRHLLATPVPTPFPSYAPTASPSKVPILSTSSPVATSTPAPASSGSLAPSPNCWEESCGNGCTETKCETSAPSASPGSYGSYDYSYGSYWPGSYGSYDYSYGSYGSYGPGSYGSYDYSYGSYGWYWPGSYGSYDYSYGSYGWYWPGSYGSYDYSYGSYSSYGFSGFSMSFGGACSGYTSLTCEGGRLILANGCDESTCSNCWMTMDYTEYTDGAYSCDDELYYYNDDTSYFSSVLPGCYCDGDESYSYSYDDNGDDDGDCTSEFKDVYCEDSTVWFSSDCDVTCSNCAFTTDFTAYTGGTYTCMGDTQGFYENGAFMGPMPGCYFEECSYSYSYSYGENDCTATCPHEPTTCDEFYSAAGLCDDCADAFMGCATSCPYEFLSYHASQWGCTYDLSYSYDVSAFLTCSAEFYAYSCDANGAYYRVCDTASCESGPLYAMDGMTLSTCSPASFSYSFDFVIYNVWECVDDMPQLFLFMGDDTCGASDDSQLVAVQHYPTSIWCENDDAISQRRSLQASDDAEAFNERLASGPSAEEASQDSSLTFRSVGLGHWDEEGEEHKRNLAGNMYREHDARANDPLEDPAAHTLHRHLLATPVPTPFPSYAPTASPSKVPILSTSSPVASSTAAPVASSTAAPVAASTAAPVASSTAAPVATSTAAPVATSTAAPVASSTAAPVAASTAAPVAASTAAPVASSTAAPVAASTAAPVATSTPAPASSGSPAPSPNCWEESCGNGCTETKCETSAPSASPGSYGSYDYSYGSYGSYGFSGFSMSYGGACSGYTSLTCDGGRLILANGCDESTCSNCWMTMDYTEYTDGAYSCDDELYYYNDDTSYFSSVLPGCYCDGDESYSYSYDDNGDDDGDCTSEFKDVYCEDSTVWFSSDCDVTCSNCAFTTDFTAYTGGTYTCMGDTQGFYENGAFMGPMPGCYFEECSYSYSYSYGSYGSYGPGSYGSYDYSYGSYGWYWPGSYGSYDYSYGSYGSYGPGSYGSYDYSYGSYGWYWPGSYGSYDYSYGSYGSYGFPAFSYAENDQGCCFGLPDTLEMAITCYMPHICGDASWPTLTPTYAPTFKPTYAPTFKPTVSPTFNPTVSPTRYPTPLPTLVTCTNGLLDSTETDVDCGGGSCPRCNVGLACTEGDDCSSSACVSSICVESPTPAPTQMPTHMPTQAPTLAPTQMPTPAPTTPLPTPVPTPSTDPHAHRLGYDAHVGPSVRRLQRHGLPTRARRRGLQRDVFGRGLYQTWTSEQLSA